MAKQTRQEAICNKILAKGLKEVKGKSTKYRTFKRENGEFYFVGKNGALRTGKSVSDSFSITSLVAKI